MLTTRAKKLQNEPERHAPGVPPKQQNEPETPPASAHSKTTKRTRDSARQPAEQNYKTNQRPLQSTHAQRLPNILLTRFQASHRPPTRNLQPASAADFGMRKAKWGAAWEPAGLVATRPGRPKPSCSG